MREIGHIDRILDKLSDLWHKHPDQRLGQVLENYAFGYIVPSPIFHVEDDVIENRIGVSIDFSNKTEEKMNEIEQIRKEVSNSKERLESILKSLDDIKDDEEGSITRQQAYCIKAIQKNDLLEVGEGALHVKEPDATYRWGARKRITGPLAGKAFYLNGFYDWELVRDEESALCLVPIKKQEE